MLDRRRRRRANINPTLVQCLVFAGIVNMLILHIIMGAVQQLRNA